ncbi:MAG TPA: dTDP-4-dehydrorhamnose reductase [Terracidiphilus sp.]|nr:dTDP-4-dehydrorhamnose reductase [Terracidiphilus sp.]
MTENLPTIQVPGPRILILGSNGQLGLELQRSFAGFGSVTALDRTVVDLAQPDQICAIVAQVRPEVILNAAAYTAVDRAESERELAYAINAETPRILAEEAARLDALLVHYSTDYVFDGTKAAPWTEDDLTNPLNAYGASKLAGEQAIQKIGGRYLIFRTSWVYGPHGKNFLLTMLRLARERERLSIVNDQIGAPTTSLALAQSTYAIVEGIQASRFGDPKAWAGLYHMTCAGATSWFGFAQAIFTRAARLGVKAPELVPIATADYPTPAARPRNSVLSNAKLETHFSVHLPSWQMALDEVVQILQPRSAQ